METDDNIYNLRLFGIFGPYENYNYRLISNAICKALQGKDIRIHQNAWFDYLYIKDFCRILPWFVDHKPQRKDYNVCTGKKVDIVSVAREILKQTGSESKLIVERAGWNREYTGSNRRLSEELGEISFTPIEQAIADMVAYYKGISIHLEGNY